MTDTSQLPAEAQESAVIAKLRAAKAAGAEEDGFTLPVSKVRVSYPRFRAFDGWERAQLQAEGNAAAVNLYYIIQVCKFDGERLKAGDYRELISDTDHMAISAKLFQRGDAEGARAAMRMHLTQSRERLRRIGDAVAATAVGPV